MPKMDNYVATPETLLPSLTAMLPSNSMVNSMLGQFEQLAVNCLCMVENAHHACSTVLISEHSLVAEVHKSERG